MKKMKKTVVTLLVIAMALSASAQGQKDEKFSPEKFQAELEAYITKEAALTAKEAAAFFPVYREMQKKQRAIYDQQRKAGRQKPADEAGCEKAIRQRDENELKQKHIQQTYHNKMLTVLPAAKLYDVLKAEDRFHRQKLRNWGRGKHDHNAPGQAQPRP